MVRPLLSVIVPVTDEAALACLESLETSPPGVEFELVVVAGADTAGIVGRLEGSVTVVRQAGTGPAAVAAGVDRARGDFLLLLDPSVRLLAGWFEPLAGVLRDDAGVGAVQPKLLDAEGKLAHAGGLVAADGALGVFGEGEPYPDAPEFSYRREPDFVTLACVLIRADALVAAGGSETISGTHRDGGVELSRALRAAGWSTVYEPRSRVILHGGRADGESSGVSAPMPEPGRRSLLFVDSVVPHDRRERLDRLAQLRRAGYLVSCHLLDGTGRAAWADELSGLGIPCFGADPQEGPAHPTEAAQWRMAYRAALPSLLVRHRFDTVVVGDGPAAGVALRSVRAFAPEATLVVDATAQFLGSSDGPRHGQELLTLGQADRVLSPPAAADWLRRQLPGTEVVVTVEAAVAPLAPVRPLVPPLDPARECRPDLVSVVIPVWNRLDMTRPCVESLRRYSRAPFEIIVVDNGSTDGTTEWLAHQPDLVVITNPENRGFAAACNQGMAAARGEWIVLLNNDTKVPRRWLDGIVFAFDAPDVGAVGPRSNSVSGPQVVAGARYGTSSEYIRFAEDWRRAHRGSTWETDRLVGFCLALRRSALDDVGGLDEAFGPGNFEDDDLCLRLRAGGWRLLVADEVMIHHEGHASFGEAIFGAMGSGLRHFQRKHGALNRAGAGTPLLSACLIVKNEEERLPDCLLSLRGLADEVVVVDTGSSDATRAIALAAGCRLIEIPWEDDFAQARNASLEAATGEWALVIDADERAHCTSPGELRTLLSRPHGDAYRLRIRSDLFGGDQGTAVSEHRLERLFRRSRFRFFGRLHEQIESVVDGQSVACTELDVVWLDHLGYRPEVRLERDKDARNKRIARATYESGEGERWYRAFVAARSTEDPEQCLRFYQEALDHMPVGRNDHRVQSLGAMAAAHLAAGRPAEAKKFSREALVIEAGDGQARYFLGAALNALGEHEEAREVLESLVADGGGRDNLIVDRRYYDLIGPIELAAAHAGLGETAAAASLLKGVARRDPLVFPAWPQLLAGLRAAEPKGWLDEIIDLAAPCPRQVLVAANVLPAEDRLGLVDRMAGSALSLVEAAFHGLVLIPFLENESQRAAAWERWSIRLDGFSAGAVRRLAEELEDPAPASALRLWERLSGSTAALGRARCHVALGSLVAATDALEDVDLAALSAVDLVFIATLALRVGDPETAVALLDAIPARADEAVTRAALEVRLLIERAA